MIIFRLIGLEMELELGSFSVAELKKKSHGVFYFKTEHNQWVEAYKINTLTIKNIPVPIHLSIYPSI